nr:unnamed protein product [uncultured bacterium]
MSSKVTIILAFIASTVIPFIQEVSDFISSLKLGVYSHEASSALSSLVDDIRSDLNHESSKDSSSPKSDAVSTMSSKKRREDDFAPPWSRFLSNR